MNEPALKKNRIPASVNHFRMANRTNENPMRTPLAGRESERNREEQIPKVQPTANGTSGYKRKSFSQELRTWSDSKADRETAFWQFLTSAARLNQRIVNQPRFANVDRQRHVTAWAQLAHRFKRQRIEKFDVINRCCRLRLDHLLQLFF